MKLFNRKWALNFSLCLVLLLHGCDKKIRGTIEVKGRVLGYYSHEPVRVTVELWSFTGRGFRTGSEADLLLDHTFCDMDGRFILRSHPSRKGIYFLMVNRKGPRKIYVDENRPLDAGDFYEDETMNCIVKLRARSDSAISIGLSHISYDFSFNPRTNADVLLQRTFYAGGIFPDSFQITYRTSTGKTPGTYKYYERKIAIKSFNDTLSTVISY